MDKFDLICERLPRNNVSTSCRTPQFNVPGACELLSPECTIQRDFSNKTFLIQPEKQTYIIHLSHATWQETLLLGKLNQKNN